MSVLKTVEGLRRLALEKRSFDGFLVMNEANMLYLAGFPGALSLLVPKYEEAILYVFSVNYEQAKFEGKGFTVELLERKENLMQTIARKVAELGIRKLATDSLNCENCRKLSNGLRKKARMYIRSGLIWELRKIKDSGELSLMARAGELATRGMEAAFQAVTPGVREYEIAAEVEYTMRRNGSWGTAFETIVASGIRSAFPHGGCTDRKIEKGDLIVIDLGATYKYYRSDLTRTIIAGEPTQKQKRIYEIVRLAHEESCEVARPGSAAKKVDATARQVIEKAGYGKCFVHGLGHGVGLEVHEPPSLSRESKDKLRAGNVVTIEPGIYIPGFGGVRIEDTLLVEEAGPTKLTKAPYTLKAKQ